MPQNDVEVVKEIKMLLYVSGSFPDNQEGIASGAKVLLDAMIEIVGKGKIKLLTTDTPIISKNIKRNTKVDYYQLSDWKISKSNIEKIYKILDENNISTIHMEYPGDLYGKTFLASFLPFFIHRYCKKKRRKISVNVRLHEFSRARFLRKVAIIPILLWADSIYVPAKKDREIVSKIGGNRVHPTTIGANIKVVSNEVLSSETITISYFGSVYQGKGIEKMLSVWKRIKAEDSCDRFRFKIIGEIGTESNNHFCDYHKQVWTWIEQYGLKDSIEVTGYISDEEVSKEIQKSQIAMLFYEDGLTLRRGSFLAYLAHGIPIITSMGDDDAFDLFDGHKGIKMTETDQEVIDAIYEFANITLAQKKEIRDDDVMLSTHFDWSRIGKKFLEDYGVMR